MDLFRLPHPRLVGTYYLQLQTHVPYFYMMNYYVMTRGGGGGAHKRKRSAILIEADFHSELGSPFCYVLKDVMPLRVCLSVLARFKMTEVHGSQLVAKYKCTSGI